MARSTFASPILRSLSGPWYPAQSQTEAQASVAETTQQFMASSVFEFAAGPGSFTGEIHAETIAEPSFEQQEGKTKELVPEPEPQPQSISEPHI